MTSKTLKQVSWLTALALGTGVGLSSPAEACSAPVCETGVEVPLPISPGTVPANLPALVLQSTKGANLVTSSANAPRLLRSNGDIVATTTVTPDDEHQTWRVVPVSPLVPGETYRLQGVGECGYTGESKPVEVSFTAGATQPLPAATGTLRVEKTARGKVRVAHGSLCSTEQDASFVHLRFTPAPELVPFLPWVRWTLEVDGTRWAAERHGAVLAEGSLGPPTQWQLSFGERRIFQVHTSCVSQDFMNGDPGLKPGRHRATLRPTLAQASTALPPVEVDFELACDARPPSPPPEPPREVEQLPLYGCSHAGGASMLALPGLLALGFLVRRRTCQVSRSGS